MSNTPLTDAASAREMADRFEAQLRHRGITDFRPPPPARGSSRCTEPLPAGADGGERPSGCTGGRDARMREALRLRAAPDGRLARAAYVVTGAIQDAPAVVDGRIVVRKQLTLTTTIDHRYMDGPQSGKLGTVLREAIERPFRS